MQKEIVEKKASEDSKTEIESEVIVQKISELKPYPENKDAEI